MRAILLVLAALIVPLIWGYAAHWLVERCWPRPGRPGPESKGVPAAEYFDYQI
jgi:hypothetical protein